MSEEDIKYPEKLVTPTFSYSKKRYATYSQELSRQSIVFSQQSTLPASSYQSNDTVMKPYDQAPPPYKENIKSSVSFPRKPIYYDRGTRKFHCCCLACGRGKQISCGIFSALLLIMVILMASITMLANNKCRNLNFNNVSPSYIQYDVQKYPEFQLTTSGSFMDGNVDIVQGLGNTTNVTIWLAGFGSYSNSNDGSRYILTIIGSDDIWSWWTAQPKCAKAHVQIELPQVSKNSLITMDTDNLDITLPQNRTVFDQWEFDLHTDTGDARLNNFSAEDIYISTNSGNIEGTMISVQTHFSAITNDGNIDLTFSLTPNVTANLISIETENGDANLRFGNTFNGKFKFTTSGGGIHSSGSNYTISGLDNLKWGQAGNGDKGQLDVDTNDGNITVEF